MHEISRLLRFLKPYRKASIAALTMLALVVIMDLAIPRFVQQIIDDGIAKNDLMLVLNTTLLMLGASILGTLLSIGNTILSVRASQYFACDLRDAIFRKIQAFSFGNLDRIKTGSLMVRLTSDVNQVQRMVMLSLRIGTRAPLLMIGSVILMIVTSPRLALIMLILMMVTGVLVVIFINKMRRLFLAIQQKLDKLNIMLQENLAGIRVVKAFVRSDHENSRFDQANTDLMSKTIEVMQLLSVLMPSMMFIINLGIIGVVWFGGNLVISDTLTVGQIVAFINYLLSTMIYLMLVAMIAGLASAAEASASRISEVLESTPHIQDLPNARPISNVKGRVVFENIAFSYNSNGNEPVLKGINLVAEPGETVAILGATGSGKSTLVQLIPRFYEVTEGRVTLDDIDIRKITQESLQAQMGIALQDTILFRGTIRDNIRYGNPKATEEEVIAAAKVTQAHDFITDLRDGYDSMVGQRGINLSGGQKQRIAIARALLIKPRILILDDSTSSVDVETEAEIQEALDQLVTDCTSFIIAQRISTVLRADKIIILDQGQIAAEGTHAELISTSPIYQEIYQSQLGDGELHNG